MVMGFVVGLLDISILGQMQPIYMVASVARLTDLPIRGVENF